eukprot:scaffold94055_cov26-Tisochrysis_lutea.AAC.1
MPAASPPEMLLIVSHSTACKEQARVQTSASIACGSMRAHAMRCLRCYHGDDAGGRSSCCLQACRPLSVTHTCRSHGKYTDSFFIER